MKTLGKVYKLRSILSNTPNSILLTVAALLPSEWEKRLVDLNVTVMTQTDLVWVDYVFVSAMAVQRDLARALIAHCKVAGVKVVAGTLIMLRRRERFGFIPDCFSER